MEYLWSMYGVSPLLLPANLQIILEYKECFNKKMGHLVMRCPVFSSVYKIIVI